VRASAPLTAVRDGSTPSTDSGWRQEVKVWRALLYEIPHNLELIWVMTPPIAACLRTYFLGLRLAMKSIA
jgi:hypothetical protein